MCGAIGAIIIVSISFFLLSVLVDRRVAVLRLVNFAVSNVKSHAVMQIAERGLIVSQKRDFLAAR